MTTVFVTRAPEWSIVGLTLCAIVTNPLLLLSASFDLSNKFYFLSAAAAWAGNVLLIVWSSLLLFRVFRKELRQDLIHRSVSVKIFKLLRKLLSRFAYWLEKVITRRSRLLLPGIFILMRALFHPELKRQRTTDPVSPASCVSVFYNQKNTE